MKNGFVVEEGTGVIVLTRAAGVSEEFFTRAKEFVPERWVGVQEMCLSPSSALPTEACSFETMVVFFLLAPRAFPEKALLLRNRPSGSQQCPVRSRPPPPCLFHR